MVPAIHRSAFDVPRHFQTVAGSRCAHVQPVVKLDFWGDFACPWSYITHCQTRRVVQVTNERLRRVSMNWHSYISDETIQPDGESCAQYMLRCWGSEGHAEVMKGVGREVGVAFANWNSCPNSLDAHRLVKLAEEEGKADEVVEQLYHHQYEAGGNISVIRDLLEVGYRAGITDVRRRLLGDEYRSDVMMETTVARRRLGIRSVPYLSVTHTPSGEQRVLEGVQRSGVIQTVVEEMLALEDEQQQQEQRREGEVVFGDLVVSRIQ